LEIIPIKPDRPIKPTFVVTAFQNKETQIYYQNEKNSISKMPNEYFLKHFDGYPLLVKTVKYGK
jgi:ABC-type bacteriocin/lantibiotic exporter with double-glycine peptidase domain